MRPTKGSPRAIVVATVALLAVLVATRTARAQSIEPPREHQGYYVGFGYHVTPVKVWEDNYSYGVWRGSEFSLRFGQLVTRRFGLGLQFHFGAAKGDGQTASTFGMELEGQWEIVRNLTLHAGSGVDTFSIRADSGKNQSLRGTAGAGYVLGLGYSWFFTHRLTGGWAATPRIEARFVPGTTASAFVGSIGIELCWWSGLPRNQLELPPSEAFKK
ncbi:MAG TPA: hypothetical protein VGP07_26115 [Polyangia bacterium]|jgi:hypothetical protein